MLPVRLRLAEGKGRVRSEMLGLRATAISLTQAFDASHPPSAPASKPGRLGLIFDQI